MRHEGSAALEDPTGAGLRGVRPKDLVQSLERGIAVLTAFGPDHPTMNLTEVAKHCGLPRSAARHFLHTLVDLGYVTSSGRQYELTPRVLSRDIPTCQSSRWPTSCAPTRSGWPARWAPPSRWPCWMAQTSATYTE